MATTAVVTIAQFEQMPEGERFELIGGELREVVPPGHEHSFVQAAIIGRLYGYLEDHPVGRVYGEEGVIIQNEPNTVLAPDAAFVRQDRVRPASKQRGFSRQLPDIAVEIVSPSDRIHEVVEKVRLYLDAGVVEVWVVDPIRRRMMVWRGDQPVQELGPGDIFEGSEMLPGFRVPVGKLFD